MSKFKDDLSLQTFFENLAKVRSKYVLGNGIIEEGIDLGGLPQGMILSMEDFDATFRMIQERAGVRVNYNGMFKVNSMLREVRRTIAQFPEDCNQRLLMNNTTIVDRFAEHFYGLEQVKYVNEYGVKYFEGEIVPSAVRMMLFPVTGFGLNSLGIGVKRLECRLHGFKKEDAKDLVGVDVSTAEGGIVLGLTTPYGVTMQNYDRERYFRDNLMHAKMTNEEMFEKMVKARVDLNLGKQGIKTKANISELFG